MERSLSDLAWHLEEPRVGQSYPNYYAAKLASSFVKVVMSGAGGDELFGGYPWRYFHGQPGESYEDYIDSYYLFWQRLVSNSELARLTAPIAKDVKDVWTRDIFKAVLSGHETELNRTEDYINNSLYFEAKTFLHGLLVVEDKLSMAHGLETRVPFLDNDLVDFSMRVPVSLKIRNLDETLRLDENEPAGKKEKYFDKTREGKAILRDAMSRHIPLSVTQLKKQGFSGPDAHCVHGERIEFVRRRLVEGESKIFEILDRDVIRDLLGQHFAGEKNRRLLVWSLLNLDSYLEQTF
jgi:asparagine synthase (glutamine-hydrolysing)